MRDLFENKAIADMAERIEKLMVDSKPKWGKFNVSQMICHLQDNFKYSLGISEEKRDIIKGPPMFIRTLVRLYLPWPKNSPTGPNMLETKPVELDKDKLTLIELMRQFRENKDHEGWPLHPFFGKLNGLAWGRLLYRHMDYHLKQFGV